MTFEEFKKKMGYTEQKAQSYDAWILSKFDRNKDGKIKGSSAVIGTEAYDKRKYENTHSLQQEYDAYVSGIEASNAQKLRQLLAQWEAEQNAENYKAAQSEQKTRAEREYEKKAELEEKKQENTKKIIISALVVVAAIFIFK